MLFLYSFAILIYGFSIRMAAIFNRKAALWYKGRRKVFKRIAEALQDSHPPPGQRKLAWFHCASLGEFEQGRPLIEAFRRQHPDYLIFLTFFSPSGFEHRKSYPGADHIFYLPLDTPSNAQKFISLVQPDLVFFIKYEFWFNYLRILQKRKIPHFLVSAIFRADQHFFKWYGDWPRRILSGFTQIFVQNPDSKELLEFIGINNVVVSGDTRFDRVVENASFHQEFPLIDSFAAERPVLVAGSTWLPDEELLIRFFKDNSNTIKIIIAPHEIRENAIEALVNRFNGQAVRYSTVTPDNANSSNVLIIDSIGMLSQLYRFARIAYVGGGFGAGIHNVLEAAVYGVPVIFGPNFGNFHEAVELITAGGGYPVHHYRDLEKSLNQLLKDSEKLSSASLASKTYVSSHTGATQTILQVISPLVH